MNEARTIIPGRPRPPDPLQDRCGPPSPQATVELLILVQVVLVYARHLLGLLEQAAKRGVSRIGQCFGSAGASFVLTNLTRGILRAIALERVLLARAGGTPEPAPRRPRKRMPAAAAPSAPRPPRPSHDRRPGLPTLRQLEAAIRRRPVESAIDDIRHDLGVSFSLCEARFGNALRDMAVAYRDTLANVLHAPFQGDAAVAEAPEQGPVFALPARKPDAIRCIMGCIFGMQQPVCGSRFAALSLGTAIDEARPP